MTWPIRLPVLGDFAANSGVVALDATGDGRFRAGEGGVEAVVATGDGKVEFVAFAGHTLARVVSALGYDAYYPVHPTRLEKPVRAVLMDLDGTSVHSERFWIRMIERTAATLLGDANFRLDEADVPYVSGHSVSEHLEYCVRKYVPGCTVEQARAAYFEHTRREMDTILAGQGEVDAFVPAPGLRGFLLALKDAGVRLALVTSGLYEKAMPEIVAAFQVMGLGDPLAFYDAIITAGFPLRPGSAGTLGELPPKPHPWLYAEAARVGLGIPFDQRHTVVGIEDSGAGVCAIRLAGFTTVGISGGNIAESGTRPLCDHFVASLSEVLPLIL